MVNYWDRLKTLKIYSLQRRRDRFMILLIYKMVAGIQDPIGFKREDIRYSDRRNITVKPILSRERRKRKWVQTLRYKAFPATAISMYNVMPGELRTIYPSVNAFKGELDRWLETIPDEPDCSNLKTNAPSNRLLDQVEYIRRNLRGQTRQGGSN